MNKIDSDTYQTGKVKKAFTAKIFPTGYFYVRLVKLVFSASNKAKKGTYGDNEWINSSCDFFNILESAGAKIYIKGIDNFRHIKEPILFIGNHMSTLETFLLPSIIAPYKKLTYVVKKSLVDYPVFKHVMKSRKPVVVSRSNPREDFKIVIKEGKNRIENEYSIVVFPQTTRSAVFDVNHFNSIGTKLALRTNTTIVPVALKTDAWANGKKYKDFGRFYPEKDVLISFGKPLVPSSENKNYIHEQVTDYIVGKLKEWNVKVVE
ncbi:MAG: 1-acyl-sn-glycerol-3-phosphate acyltransferase [Flexistipes sinusarabici]|uniref:1-acyl-sn-glycerol-3-phosphate acyltransferase n=1 Tax=Flexistipes sinusarabici TaxID=2352 RepID=A0A5D0MLD1_FLESI|nr:lysophospholipid acyltransferase family protein [Flexistipes sinusarabici]TYB32745.1 MAG: 1-acyl-sn-glycerol-3-phosphate acyltransferase [Flexistipes sinusarabici]